MARFNHILFPVDFSERCRMFLPHVGHVAEQMGAKVTLLHGFHVLPPWYGGMEISCPVPFDDTEIRANAKNQIETFRSDMGRDFDVSTEGVIADGDPAIVIVCYAESQGVDLVMMPTNGCGTFRRLLIGSVTAKVLHDLQLPVWTSAHQASLPERKTFKCEHMLCAVDLNPESARIVRCAQEIAREFGAQLRVVHAVQGAGMDEGVDYGVEFREFLFDTACDAVDKIQATAGTNLEVSIESGKVSTVVHDVAKQFSSDLVIIGRSKLHAVLGRLRTHSYGIINSAPCSVLSI